MRGLRADGGDIVIEAHNLTLTDGARIESSTLGRGEAGNVTVTDFTSTITALPVTFDQAQVLVPQQCAERFRHSQRSRFVVAGRKALPPEPDAALASPLIVRP